MAAFSGNWRIWGLVMLAITPTIWNWALESAADRIARPHAGCTVEEAKARDFVEEETLRHPYTKALWRVICQCMDSRSPKARSQARLEVPRGCPFPGDVIYKEREVLHRDRSSDGTMLWHAR
ncbi:MAG: hypothetical protein ACLTLQ_04295 [[Clostridium] scindens]